MPDATTIEGALVSRLKADATLAGLIGGRIHPMSDPQNVARPKLTYQRIDTVRNTSVGGFTNDGPTGLAVARVQFDAWADDLLAARAVSGAVRKSLNGFRGMIAGVEIGSIIVVDEMDGSSPLLPGSEKPAQRVTLDLKAMFKEN